MKTILFIDDEPNILSGIRRILHPLRTTYDLRFCATGAEALELMARQPVVVVVSDMRMPVMDGIQLLQIIQERHPQTIRIMLTGQADDEAVLKTVTVVHQFLSKPCDPDRLRDLLNRAVMLHDRLNNDSLKSLIAGIGTLPSLPSIYERLQETLRNPEASADEVAAIIEQDVAMTAKLLQLVNSSFFGLYNKVDSPARAVKLLGLDTIKVLVLGLQIFTEARRRSLQPLLSALWRHSIAVAQCSKRIAISAQAGQEEVNQAFIGGMLHDIGKLVLLSHYEEAYTELIAAAEKEQVCIADMERRQLQATHAEIGAYLIGLWGFNGPIIEATAFHHQPGLVNSTAFSAAVAVHLADFGFYRHASNRAAGKAPALDDSLTQLIDEPHLGRRWLAAGEDFWKEQEDDLQASEQAPGTS